MIEPATPDLAVPNLAAPRPAATLPSTAARPVTRTDLVSGLTALGLAPGSAIMVHTALSRLGWVVGGEQTVIDALRDAVGPAGTLVMPAQSWQLCDPAVLADPAVPTSWYPAIRAALPAYDPARTPTRTMGAVAELFRTLPGARRSDHPQRSVAALGPLAAQVTAVHDVDCASGERSPMRALYDAGAHVLLLGVGFDKCTALHLAEERTDYPGRRWVPGGGPILRGGRRVWLEWEELDLLDDDFAALGAAYLASGLPAARGPVGETDAVLVPVRELVDFAGEWMAAHRR